jgi:uncharacterized membrane protein
MDLEKLYGICNKLKNRVEVLEREKLERDKLERQQTNEIIETHQPERVAERQHTQKVSERQKTEKVAEKKQPEEVVEEVMERRQPKEVVERQKPSDKRSCNAVSFGNIPKVITMFINSEIPIFILLNNDNNVYIHIAMV